jgi:hypothetical protein
MKGTELNRSFKRWERQLAPDVPFPAARRDTQTTATCWIDYAVTSRGIKRRVHPSVLKASLREKFEVVFLNLIARLQVGLRHSFRK